MNVSKRDLPYSQLWNISFGFFGVQIAYSLQSANISRIFATLGADPHNLSYFWILPPLMGMIVQPVVGVLSDRTWTKLGRRIPYLLVGSIISVIVMCLLPNSGSFNLSVSSAMVFGLIALMLLDTSINMAMQPFKMMVGDMVNEKQKGLAYSIQSFLSNAGSLVGYLFPIIFTFIGISNVAAAGVVPDSVIYSFYGGAAILILCVLYTVFTVKEMPPKEYAEFHGIEDISVTKKSANIFQLLAKAPSVFWSVGLVQFFSWAAFMYMWTYTNGGIAETIWNTSDVKSAAYQEAGNWVGVVFAVQAVGSVIWAMVIPRFKSYKTAYAISLILGGIGFVATMFVHDRYVLFIPYLLIGCAWAAILALPFTILTNALKGDNMGAYLGLFNGTICLPQIVAALLGGVLFRYIAMGSSIAMLGIAGALLFLAAASVFVIKENKTQR
ncbi:MFS transporter [Chryseobacterium sp. SC28]|uniref:MFS transporter n=1 Tax=Chryseobacterium sp. SC28 TaxID=2268028 RepID=UPI000F64F7E7|nr:MFS transporter [Chryseobacterium sp. SC28]RRQ45539.1 MFS transporter [Chryseobacterium sp. SC28]